MENNLKSNEMMGTIEGVGGAMLVVFFLVAMSLNVYEFEKGKCGYKVIEKEVNEVIEEEEK